MLFPRVKIVETLDPNAPFDSFLPSEIDTLHDTDNGGQKEVTSLVYSLNTGRTPAQIAYDLSLLIDMHHQYIESPSRCIISTTSNSIYVEHSPLRMQLSTLIQARKAESKMFSPRDILTCGAQILSALIYVYHPRKKQHGTGPYMPVCNLTDISPDTITCNSELTSFSLAGLWLLIPEIAHYTPQECNNQDVDIYIVNQVCRILYKMATFKDINYGVNETSLQGIQSHDLRQIFERSLFASDKERWKISQLLNFMARASGVREIDNLEYNSLAALSNSVEQTAMSKAHRLQEESVRLQNLLISKANKLASIKLQNARLAEERDRLSQKNNEIIKQIKTLKSETNEGYEQINAKLMVFDDAMTEGRELLRLLQNSDLLESAECSDVHECFIKLNEVVGDVLDMYTKLKAIEETQDIRAAGGLEQYIQQLKAQEGPHKAVIQRHKRLSNMLEFSKRTNDKLRGILLTDAGNFDIKKKFNCLYCQNNKKPFCARNVTVLLFATSAGKI
ncbi:Hypothetical protein GLP15_3564 [Giardia lamblia P15]|uniref:Uncharacterized protein n=1 Tax=Giardia intestinalis (strain P15) TaxID=658858 RepID=E1F7H9_GIAIA|nr:Hypothetical protein GLP15_3564 [Giardia lamblia P15]